MNWWEWPLIIVTSAVIGSVIGILGGVVAVLLGLSVRP